MYGSGQGEATRAQDNGIHVHAHTLHSALWVDGALSQCVGKLFTSRIFAHLSFCVRHYTSAAMQMKAGKCIAHGRRGVRNFIFSSLAGAEANYIAKYFSPSLTRDSWGVHLMD